MSTVIRPRGPLSPRVYWTRRLLLVVVVMVFGALLWWVMPGVGGSGSASAGPGNGAPADQQPSTDIPHTTPATTRSTTDDQPGQQPAVTHHPTPGHANDPSAGPGGSAHTTGGPPTEGGGTPKHLPLPPPSGPCDPTKLTLAVVVPDAPEAAGTTVGLRISTEDGSTCTLGITPSLLETRIKSGDVVVWQSSSCPDGLPAKNVVVRPKAVVVYSYAWDGQVNPDSCSASNVMAKPGYYWAEAALIGGEPHKSQFQVTAPTTS